MVETVFNIYLSLSFDQPLLPLESIRAIRAAVSIFVRTCEPSRECAHKSVSVHSLSRSLSFAYLFVPCMRLHVLEFSYNCVSRIVDVVPCFSLHVDIVQYAASAAHRSHMLRFRTHSFFIYTKSFCSLLLFSLVSRILNLLIHIESVRLRQTCCVQRKSLSANDESKKIRSGRSRRIEFGTRQRQNTSINGCT